MSRRIATDIGGTFTDLVGVDEESGELTVVKRLTTPPAFARGVLDALGDAPLDDVSAFVHGTTVVINAITERTGVLTGLVTTAGFRDVLEIARGNRPDMYNLRSRKPVPFVRRRHRFEVRERIDRNGEVLRPLELDDLDGIVEACRRERLEALAVCLLHSYARPDHERLCRRHLEERLPGVPITISSDLTREWREYERSSTAVLNAYVQPGTSAYLRDLSGALLDRGLRGDIHLMQSNGGTATLEAASVRPISLIESGPAAGIIGAAAVASEAGRPEAIYLDIGGTTAKCSLIEGGVPKTTTQYRLEWRPDFAGYPVLVPVIDVVEIGAGGGSIAWIDDGGALRVGPRSAGADPGPACYGRGGTELTVTDAKLLAGVLNPEYLLGGELRVFPELAREAAARFAGATGASVAEVANGIIRLVNANMINALKLVSVRRGYDPRDFVLVAGGGGGAMHAAALASELGAAQVLVPRNCGVFSAWGMLMTDPRLDLGRTRIVSLAELGDAELEAVFAELEQEAERRLAPNGDRVTALEHVRSADMRYRGQEHAVRVPVPPGAGIEEVEARFHTEHERAYTFQLPGAPCELVTFHLATYLRLPRPAFAAARDRGAARPKGRRVVDFDVDGVHEAPVFERDELPPGFTTEGPAIVEEPSSTTLVHPRQTLEVDTAGNLVIHVR